MAAGNRVIAPELAVSAWTGSDRLTDREREVLREVGEGHPNVEIAQRLHLAEGTVRNYLSSAIVKLGAETAPRRSPRPRKWDTCSPQGGRWIVSTQVPRDSFTTRILTSTSEAAWSRRPKEPR